MAEREKRNDEARQGLGCMMERRERRRGGKAARVGNSGKRSDEAKRGVGRMM